MDQNTGVTLPITLIGWSEMPCFPQNIFPGPYGQHNIYFLFALLGNNVHAITI